MPPRTAGHSHMVCPSRTTRAKSLKGFMTPVAALLAALLVLTSPPAQASNDGKNSADVKAAAPRTKGQHERVYVEDVLQVAPGQWVVLLRSGATPVRYLPIAMGEGEALAIRLRLDRREPPRPLTLNLLEQLLADTHVVLTDIAIDGFRGGLFLGKIRLRQQKRSWEMDARPSDAIGLAISRNVPIFVRREIMADVGVLAPEPEYDASDHHAGATPRSPGSSGNEVQATDYAESL